MFNALRVGPAINPARHIARRIGQRADYQNRPHPGRVDVVFYVVEMQREVQRLFCFRIAG